MFFFLCLQIPWIISFVASFSPAFLNVSLARQTFRSSFRLPTISFALYIAIVLFLGISLFQVTITDGIQTPWRNNYGDLAFHVGMITSFVWGDNFPPQYHLFAGTSLSYPFLINFWTATLWWIHPTFQTLKIIFVFQWCILWSIVYFALDGDRQRLLPWAALFGGGSWLTLGQETSALISQGYPWAPFLSTIWVTQRSAIFGAAVSLAAIQFYHTQFKQTDRKSEALILGTLLGLMPLVHTHMFIVTTGYIFLCSVFKLIQTRIVRWKGDVPHESIQTEVSLFKFLKCFSVGLVISVVSIPWLIGKSGIVSFSTGWMPWHLAHSGYSSEFINLALMWVANAHSWILLLVALWIASRVHIAVLSIVVIWLIGNFVQLSVWDWDQIKFFIALYLITLSLWSEYIQKRAFWAEALLIVSIMPSTFDVISNFVNFHENTVYTSHEISDAEKIRKFTPANAVFLAKPDHNSIITLTGRRLYFGYEGTLHSHGLNYQDRRKSFVILQKAVDCSESISFKPCPTHLLWTKREWQYWKSVTPSQIDGLKKTPFKFLYEIDKRRQNHKALQ
ncbi:MAG: hypothetical protein KDD53_04885 [Bdellovibrionales bacterium]|nr:hypothetical protein [Bdellovibrionales bacterium]